VPTRLGPPLPAVAIALICALAAAGCGLGPGEGLGEVELTVTRDYGAEPLLRRSLDDVTESDTAMRVLERNAGISTRYGGGFVQSIDGLEAEERFGRSSDWFYYVNGVEASVGAADYSLRGGEAIWWDYRDWTAAMRVPAVVGSWPQPFRDGYDGRRRPVAVECQGGGRACAEVRDSIEGVGVSVASGSPRVAGGPEGAIRVLVGPWALLRRDPAAAQIEDGPQASGVFADFEARGRGFELRGLGEDGEAARAFGADAGIVAATRRYDAPPVWVVTGASAAGVRAAAGLLDAAGLRDHYAVVTERGQETPLPVQ
jgi:uncharacterized protein DUF4430